MTKPKKAPRFRVKKSFPSGCFWAIEDWGRGGLTAACLDREIYSRAEAGKICEALNRRLP